MALFAVFKIIVCTLPEYNRGSFLLGGDKMTSEEKRQWAIRQLQLKYEELDRLPKKTDYDGATCSRIKAFLGPWHRALESAGLRAVTEKRKKR